MIIGITGKKNVGKDLVDDFLVKKGFIKLTFSTILKNAAKELFNWNDHQVNADKEKIDPKWNITPTEVLKLLETKFLKENLGKKLNNQIEFCGNKKLFSFHIKNLFLKNKDLFLSKKNIVISDIRFKDEYNFVKWVGGKILKINSLNIQGYLQTYQLLELSRLYEYIQQYYKHCYLPIMRCQC